MSVTFRGRRSFGEVQVSLFMKNDRPKSQRNLLKTDETSFPMRDRSEHPSMIQA